MFNAPRQGMSQSAYLNGLDPLANSAQPSELDPWSTAPTRQPTPPEPASFIETPAAVQEPALIDDAPPLYLSLYDELQAGTGQVSLVVTQRLLSTSKLPPATIEKILRLTCQDKTSLSRQEFYCALGLVALAQSQDGEVSIGRLAAAFPSLPLPNVTLLKPVQTRRVTEVTMEKQERVDVSLLAEKEGWFLQKYRVESEKRNTSVLRRYSDFVWLSDTLLKRYPFRLLPGLPPKRISPDAIFLERRRRGLKRFIEAVVNHPVLADDGAVGVFLTEANFEAWRKRTKVSTDEESGPVEEAPSELEDRLTDIRNRLPGLIGCYQNLVLLAERALGRLQTSSADETRYALSLRTVGEELAADGVRGLAEVAGAWERVALGHERRIASMIVDVEALKAQRDLYVSVRDLLSRHDKLSKDNVDALRKKVEGRERKIDALRLSGKQGWQQDADKLVAANEQDNAAVRSALARRVFIRSCLWHELGVLRGRQRSQAVASWRQFARREVEAKNDVWEELLDSMPE